MEWRRTNSGSSARIVTVRFISAPPAAAALAVVPPILPENIGEDLLRIVGAETVHRHSLIDDGAQAAWCVISN
jgi:hypothetical protein